jgi:hypothetical protein
MLREDTLAGPRPRLRAKRAAAVLEATGSPEAAGLFEALRQWRAGEAKTQGVPPYVIFHDTTLREIAAVRPDGLGELGDGLVGLLLGDEVAGVEGFDALGVEFDELVVGGGVGEVGLGGAEAVFVGGGVDEGEDVAGFDAGVIVDEDLLDEAGDLGADLDGGNGLELAGGGDVLGESAACDGGGVEDHGCGFLAIAPPDEGGGG